MLKQLSLSNIVKALYEKSESSPHQFLFFLGTSSKFTPKPTLGVRDYEHGESLSYTAQVISSLLDEKGATATKLEKRDALSFSSHSVDVLNGPSPIGSEVGERIAQGLYLALSAIAQGKQTLQVFGHSRGAVEALLLIHEIERIRKALATSEDLSLNEILLKTPCPYTRAALIRFAAKPSTETKEERKLLKEKLDALKINSFLIDPVPGESDVRLIGSHFSWRDDRIHQKPPGDRHELILCRDERSVGFYPVLPDGIKPLVVPGHHGSATGNPYTQAKEDLPSEFKAYDTYSVQNLMLIKILLFIQNTTHVLQKPLIPLDLKHPELDKITNQFLDSNAHQQEELLLDGYTTVQKNNPAFLQFTQTSYTPFAGSYGVSLAEDGHRLVRQASGYISMKSLIHSGPFVNDEHAKLLLSKFLPNLNKDLMSAEKILKKLTKMLYLISQEKSALCDVIQSTEGRSIFIHNLSLSMEAICQEYLNSITKLEKEENIFALLHRPFQILSDEKLPRKHQEFRKEALSILQNNLQQIMDVQLESVIQRARAIQEEPCEMETKSLLPKLTQIQELLEVSKALQKKCVTLQLIIQNLTPHHKATDLTAYDTALIRQAGLILMTNQVDLNKAPLGIHPTFFEIIKAEAIALGAHSPEVKALMQTKDLQTQEIADLQQFNEQLNTPEEMNHLQLIQNKLNPLTVEYLQHLQREANALTPTLKSTSIDAPMQAIRFQDPELAKAYGLIKMKFDAVLTAHRKLMYTKGLPSTRIDEFIRTLKQHDKRLQLHRDPPWIAYFKACLAAVAIIATGILPGVIALSIYAYRTKKTPFFFAQSHGARFVEEAVTLAGPKPLSRVS